MATEKRLIDANALMKAIKSFRWFGVPNTLQLMFSYLRIIIRDQPTVDAVEVVRCKDCKNRTLDFFGGHCCKLHKGLAMVTDESFCSYGERKDNGQ